MKNYSEKELNIICNSIRREIKEENNYPYQHANDKHYIKTAGICYFTVCGIEQ